MHIDYYFVFLDRIELHDDAGAEFV